MGPPLGWRLTIGCFIHNNPMKERLFPIFKNKETSTKKNAKVTVEKP